MSFDINFGKNLSGIQASSKTTDGGAGNTGYFQRESQGEENLLGFAKDYPADSFEKIELPEENQKTDIIDMIFDFFSSIVNFFKKFISKFLR